ncbi:MAG: hypothetical protein CBC46_00940 [Verrucomicrobiaceae bacterium TMED86]|nr:MAG: hypothetical protein CBC46_00940 [Verrucomicrobiaceae bacterium TMED86]
MSDKQWYYFDPENQQQGPFSIGEIRQFIAEGILNHQSFLWHDGLTTWTAANKIAGVLATPAPAPDPVDSTNLNKRTSPNPGPGGKTFPVPSVKKSSFGLFITSYLIGFFLLAVGLLIILSASAQNAREEREGGPDFSQIEEVGNPTDRSAPQKEDSRRLSELKSQTMVGIGVLIASGFGFIFGGIYSYIILFRAWKIIQVGGARTSPGKAAGLLLIPIFNFYWIFVAYYGWAIDWTRIRSSYSNLMATPRAPSGTFLAGSIFVILFFPIGVFFFFWMISQMCKVINHMASAYALSRPLSKGLTGTKDY